jgi:hypothetical protein
MALTTAGVNFLASAVLGQGTPFDSANAFIGVGDGQTAFSVSQTNLVGTNKFRKGMDPLYPILHAPSVTFRSTFNTDEANFAWHEWGVFNAATGGVMLNRVVESNGTKQNNQTWILEVEVTFTTGG